MLPCSHHSARSLSLLMLVLDHLILVIRIRIPRKGGKHGGYARLCKPIHLFWCAFKLSWAGGERARCDDRYECMDMHAKALQWWWIVPHHLSTEACYIPHDFLRCYISSLQLRSAFFTPFFRSGYGGSIFYYKRALAALFTAWIIPFIVEWFFFLSDPHVLYYYYHCKFVLQEIRGSGVV